MSDPLIYQKENLFSCTQIFVVEDCEQFELINVGTEWADKRDRAFEKNTKKTLI